MRPCVCAWVCVIVSTDPHWQMRHFWAIVSMDPYCCLCIHIPHYPHPRPDLNHNPNPIPKPKYWPNVKLFIRISTNTYNPTCLPTEWRQSYATNQQLVRTVGRFLLAELTIRRFVSTTRQGCSLGLDVSVSRRSRDSFAQRLGLVSDWKSNVSVSSRSRASGSRLQVTFFS